MQFLGEKRNRGHFIKIATHVTQKTAGDPAIFTIGSVEITVSVRSTWANHEHGERGSSGKRAKNIQLEYLSMTINKMVNKSIELKRYKIFGTLPVKLLHCLISGDVRGAYRTFVEAASAADRTRSAKLA